jgi:hypothetical protein
MKKKTEENSKITWLASYPKSGNTWFRMFLSALAIGDEIDINDLIYGGIYSARFAGP